MGPGGPRLIAVFSAEGEFAGAPIDMVDDETRAVDGGVGGDQFHRIGQTGYGDPGVADFKIA